SDEQRARGKLWISRFAALIEEMTGVTYHREIRFQRASDGGTTVLFVLRQASETAVATAMMRLGELVTMLIYLARQPEVARRAHLATTARQGILEVEGIYDLLQPLNADPMAKMGVDQDPNRRHPPRRGQSEVWLRFKLPPPPVPLADPAESDESEDQGQLPFP